MHRIFENSMSSSLKATGILRCKPKIAKSCCSNMATIVTMIILHLCQINGGRWNLELLI